MRRIVNVAISTKAVSHSNAQPRSMKYISELSHRWDVKLDWVYSGAETSSRWEIRRKRKSWNGVRLLISWWRIRESQMSKGLRKKGDISLSNYNCRNSSPPNFWSSTGTWPIQKSHPHLLKPNQITKAATKKLHFWTIHFSKPPTQRIQRKHSRRGRRAKKPLVMNIRISRSFRHWKN